MGLLLGERGERDPRAPLPGREPLPRGPPRPAAGRWGRARPAPGLPRVGRVGQPGSRLPLAPRPPAQGVRRAPGPQRPDRRDARVAEPDHLPSWPATPSPAPPSSAAERWPPCADLDGDGRPDLVSAAQNVAPLFAGHQWTAQAYGHPDRLHWRVWRNTGDGFAARPVEWPVPADLGPPETGPALLNGQPSSLGQRHWNTLDLDGDHRPDLVSPAQNVPPLVAGANATAQVYGHPDDPHWRVWRNTGDGFAPAAARWPVPLAAGPAITGPAFIAGRPASIGDPHWTVIDLDGDGHLDLLSPARNVEPIARGLVSTPQVYGHPARLHWRLWRGE
ncbi:MAG: FG-GAP-like repeat-containing protein [bacterium]